MAKVTYKRVQTNDEVSGIPVLDGQLIYSKQGKTFMDYGTDRVPINGTTDDEISNSSTNPVENRAVKSYVDTTKSQILEEMTSGKILWENQNPNAQFGNQTIYLSDTLDDYDAYEILFYQSNSTFRINSSGRILVGYGTLLGYNTRTPKYRATGATVSGNSIAIEDCNSLTGIGTTEVDNTSIIPAFVIAYKSNYYE